MDPNSARSVLRLEPGIPLTPPQIEAAYAAESWTRHPSRYPDEAARRDAEAWALTLAEARGVLLAEVAPAWRAPEATAVVHAPRSWPAPVPTAAPAPAPEARRRRLPGWAIAVIAVGSVAVLGLVAVAGFGLLALVQSGSEAFAEGVEEAQEAAVERYQAGETLYTFPAALEIYTDGRHWRECPEEIRNGCWDMAVIPETDCDEVQITLGFSDRSVGGPTHTEQRTEHEVAGYEPIPVMFGNDDYEYGWIEDLVCLDDPTA